MSLSVPAIEMSKGAKDREVAFTSTGILLPPEMDNQQGRLVRVMLAISPVFLLFKRTPHLIAAALTTTYVYQSLQANNRVKRLQHSLEATIAVIQALYPRPGFALNALARVVSDVSQLPNRNFPDTLKAVRSSVRILYVYHDSPEWANRFFLVQLPTETVMGLVALNRSMYIEATGKFLFVMAMACRAPNKWS
jgi:hypothetical protein